MQPLMSGLKLLKSFYGYLGVDLKILKISSNVHYVAVLLILHQTWPVQAFDGSWFWLWSSSLHANLNIKGQKYCNLIYQPI